MSVRIVNDALAAAKIERVTRELLERTTDEIFDDVDSRVPVDTGALKDSLFKEISEDGQSAIIGVTMDYGLAVELGTSKQSAQPYLRPAAYKNRG